MKRLALLAFTVIFLANCGSEDTDILPDTDAPSIPNIRSFIMDFGIIEPASGGIPGNQNNWTVAVLNVAIWNTVLTTDLLVPAAAFTNAIGRVPTFDASIPGWVWEYDFAVLEVEHSGKLIGKVTTSEVQWEMLVSRDGFYDDYSWFTGTTALDGQSGTWTINRDENNPEPFLFIEWSRTLDGSMVEIKYTNIASNDPNKDGFIVQRITSGTEFDRFYDVYFANNDNTVNIESSSQNKNGQVKDPFRFGDDAFRCWDQSQNDIECPS